jgi:hypothetical protein
MINVMDIETFEENEKVIPYCVCLDMDNCEYFFYYKNNIDIIEEVLQTVINKSRQDLIEIYVHNLNFDGVIIIEYLTFSKFLFKIKSINTNLY